MLSVSHRENQPPPFGKLRKERLRHRRSSSGDKDGVERCEFRQSKCSVAAMHMRIGVAKLSQFGRSARRKLRTSLDGKNFPGQTRENCGLIPAAGANFQNPVSCLQVQCSGHGRNDVGLRNSLTSSNGQGEVIIRVRTQLRRQKFVSRHFRHRHKHSHINDAASPQLLFNHFRALSRVFFFLKHA